MGDIDLGEMFLNFPFDPKLQKFAGVDLTNLKDKLQEAGINLGEAAKWERLHMRWVRCLMGVRSSPYNAVRYFA